ncbi:MAG: ammonia-dependent NAD(+) synthetase [Actinomycetaceae bacterium]|nr:ammonia-dependent NAD(+) synthetase [Arcanobacterium sp.]MDD7505494.1 ammonia-dependent NAD(+) synthetase [Actinomycetaceae bacterium]MDY6143475.1 ammonia-dependent NAD(+) synthetase [Arcanobacterium sp.]
MRELQQHIIDTLHVKPSIDPALEVEARVNFLADYLRSTHTKGFVLGISGGVDSSLGGRLAQLAAQKIRDDGAEATFVAVRLPYKVQVDESDAQRALDFIDADRVVTFNIGDAVDAFESEYAGVIPTPMTDFTKGNTKARLRMVAQYAIAGDNQMLVVGTDHAAEAVTGFYTKFGDGGADVMPLAGLNKRQIRKITEYLGAPQSVWEKKPTADLLDATPGRLDEDELGLAYDDIDDFLEGKDVPHDVAEKLEAYFMRTRHKRTMPVAFYDSWWR